MHGRGGVPALLLSPVAIPLLLCKAHLLSLFRERVRVATANGKTKAMKYGGATAVCAARCEDTTAVLQLRRSTVAQVKNKEQTSWDICNGGWYDFR